MTKMETKEFITKYFDAFTIKNGFKLYTKKKGDIDLLYIKEHEYGRDTISISIYNYAVSHQIIYHYGKFYNAIENIVELVNKKIKLNPPYSREQYYTTLTFGYESLNSLNKSAYLPYLENEEQVKQCVGEIISFSNETAFPLLEKMNSIKFLDNVINGIDFWEDSWQKKFAFSYFFLQRFIIAKLANKHNYNEFVEIALSRIEKRAKEQEEVFDRENLLSPVPYVLDILKHIEPLKSSLV